MLIFRVYKFHRVSGADISHTKLLMYVWTFVSGLKWLVSNKKMVFSLYLVSMKWNPDEKNIWLGETQRKNFISTLVQIYCYNTSIKQIVMSNFSFCVTLKWIYTLLKSPRLSWDCISLRKEVAVWVALKNSSS